MAAGYLSANIHSHCEGGMTSGDHDSRASLNEFQARRLSVTCQYIDRVVGEIEEILHSSGSKAAFPKLIQDVTPAQRRTIEDYLARIRAQLVRVLDGQGIPRPEAWIPASRAVYTSLTVIDIAVEELRPRYMRGYGEVPAELATELEGISGELRGLVARVNQYLLQGAGEDLKNRLLRLEQTTSELELLARIERVVAERGLVEFRSTLAGIVDRLEDQSLEIAVFGRVSAGKSSLLNAILGEEVLPVGVTPITAVPTRIRFGEAASLTICYAERPKQTLEISRLIEVASEKQNPHNEKRVTRIVLELPSARLREGVTLVDTPGLGSLATTGASETLAYLPKCDLGVVLIDTGSTPTVEDLRTIETLQESAVPVQVLLSKADQLSNEEMKQMTAYVREHVSRECHLDVKVYAVSAMAGHKALLERWFESEIYPLFERSRELKALSIKRKVGALRDSVVAALSLRVRRSRGVSGTDREKLREVEAGLRRATGKITQTRTQLENEMQAFSRDGKWLLEQAADRLAEEWRKGAAMDTGMLLIESVLRNVHKQVNVYRDVLEKLARELHEELSRAANALNLPQGPSEEEFVSTIRAMPVFDFAVSERRLRRPKWSRVFGKVVARAAVRHAVRSQLEGSLNERLAVYCGVYRDWSASILQQLERRFSPFADGYRAQAERAQGGGAIGSAEEQALLNDLQSLGGTTAENEAGLSVASAD
jgi:GTP-binding protein EngB required for normal cell division